LSVNYLVYQPLHDDVAFLEVFPEVHQGLSYTVEQPAMSGGPAADLAGLAYAPLSRAPSVLPPGPATQEAGHYKTAQTTKSRTVLATGYETAKNFETPRPRLAEGFAGFVPAPFRMIPVGRAHSDRVVVLQQWEGTVSSVSGDEVTAVVHDWTNPTMPDEEVTVSIEEFSPDEQPLLTPGTVFYWSIGYRTRSGTRERVSSFQLRRLPPPSQERPRPRRE
jgi:hypothetical protein